MPLTSAIKVIKTVANGHGEPIAKRNEQFKKWWEKHEEDVNLNKEI